MCNFGVVNAPIRVPDPQQRRRDLDGIRKPVPTDEELSRLPDGARPLETVEDPSSKAMLELDDQPVRQAWESLVTGRTDRDTDIRVRVEDVEKLFLEHAGDEEHDVTEGLDEGLRELRNVEEGAERDQTWDKACAQALNTFDLVTVKYAGKVNSRRQLAACGQGLQVRGAKCGTICRPRSRSPDPSIRRPRRAAPRVSPPGLLHTVERDQQGVGRVSTIDGSSTGHLAKAIGALIEDLTDAATAPALGEAQLIDAIQSASKTFWTAVQHQLTSRS